MTVEDALKEMWRDLRDDARRQPAVVAVINFACDVELLTLEQHELWLRRIQSCPGHDDEGGRAWCAYCGDMPDDAPLTP